MLPLLLIHLSSPVSAAEVSCDELVQMAEMGLPESAIIESLNGNFVRPEVPDCMKENGLAQGIVDAAHERVDNPPDITPQAPFETGELSDPARKRESEASLTKRALSAKAAFQATSTEGCSGAYLMLNAPHPGVAALTSLGIGFGAGEFYVGNPKLGFLLAAAEIGLLSYGLFSESTDLRGVYIPFLGIFSLRGIDAFNTSQSARKQIREMTAHCL
jgi:hypothetical protein